MTFCHIVSGRKTKMPGCHVFGTAGIRVFFGSSVLFDRWDFKRRDGRDSQTDHRIISLQRSLLCLCLDIKIYYRQWKSIILPDPVFYRGKSYFYTGFCGYGAFRTIYTVDRTNISAVLLFVTFCYKRTDKRVDAYIFSSYDERRLTQRLLNGCSDLQYPVTVKLSK